MPGARGAMDTDCLGVLRGSGARTNMPSGKHVGAKKRKQLTLLQSLRLSLPREDGEPRIEIKIIDEMLSVPPKVQ